MAKLSLFVKEGYDEFRGWSGELSLYSYLYLLSIYFAILNRLNQRKAL